MESEERRSGVGMLRPVARGSSKQPLYLAVYRGLRESLQAGQWALGSSLPSEADLSQQFAVSRITIRHALGLLEAEGYIRKARARRPIVVATAPRPPGGWTIESLDDVVAMVSDARLQVRSYRAERSGETALFGLPAGTPLHCLRSVLLRADKPYARSIIYFPPAVGSRLSRPVFNDTVVFRVLQRELGVRLDDVQLTIWAEPATLADAASLHCPVGSALLVMRLLYRQDGDVVEVAYSRSLASEVRLSTRLRTRTR